jgi:hypothetical protein
MFTICLKFNITVNDVSPHLRMGVLCLPELEMMHVSPTSVSEKNDSVHIYIHTYIFVTFHGSVS